MRSVRLSARNDFDEWRAAARRLLLDAVPPDEVVWLDPVTPHDLFVTEDVLEQVSGRKVGVVPQRFIDWAADGICHRDPERFALLYRLLWRLQKDKGLMEARSDPDVGRLDRRVSAVRRDVQQLKASLRFRSAADAAGLQRFAAWCEPEHYVLEGVAPFFVRRFPGMVWAIVTPYRSAFWDGDSLAFGPGGRRADVPAEDAIDAAWQGYAAAIFNPARRGAALLDRAEEQDRDRRKAMGH